MNKTILLTLAGLICNGAYGMESKLTKDYVNKNTVRTEYLHLLSTVVVSAHHAQLPRDTGMAGIVSQTLIEYPFEVAIESETVLDKLNQACVTTLQEFDQEIKQGATNRVALWKGLQKALSQQIPEVVYPDSFDEDIKHNGNYDVENQKILRLNTTIPVTKNYVEGYSALFLQRAIIVSWGLGGCMGPCNRAALCDDKK